MERADGTGHPAEVNKRNDKAIECRIVESCFLEPKLKFDIMCCEIAVRSGLGVSVG